PDFDVERTQIDQVLTNLLENALRHGRGAPVTIGALCVGSMVEGRVDDGGPGFVTAVGERSIDFFATAVPTGVGGIGLAVCKAIVEAHGGTIRLGDRPGGGARVS